MNKNNNIILLKSFLYWAVMAGFTGLAVFIQLIGIKEVGSGGSGFLPVSIYTVNPVFFTIGVLVFLAAAFFMWFSFLRVCLAKIWNDHWGYKLVYYFFSATGIIGCFWMAMMVILYRMGLFSGLKPSALEAEVFLMPGILLIMVIAGSVRIHRSAGR